VGLQSIQDGAEHLDRPLGEWVVGVAGGLVTVGKLGLVKSITISGVSAVASEKGAEGHPEEGENKGTEDKGKESKDDGILDWGGIESDGGGSGAAYTDVAQPRVTLLLVSLSRGRGCEAER